MGRTLYLIETRAKYAFECPACERRIPSGTPHFRHDPHPYARMFRGEPTTHWCYQCIAASDPTPKDMTGRIRLPVVRVLGRSAKLDHNQLPLFAPLHVGFVGIGSILSEQLANEPSLIHKITPEEFEEFICDRLFAMGFEPRKVGATNRKDGGVDVVFWPRQSGAFPFLGAAQVKHHIDPRISEGPRAVREFAGTLGNHAFNAGLLITNTSFSPDAEWFAREHAKLLRLRDFGDIRRWLLNNFNDEAEWREIPSSIELCPGIVIKIR